MKTVAIIQARLSSTRLPRKVLADIGGESMLERVVGRLSRCALLDQVVVATSDDAGDDELVAFCEARDIPVARGPLDDVLARYLAAARAFDADVVVRVTSDCPLIDPALVDDVVREFHTGAWDYVANRLLDDRTYPIGLDAEAFSLAGLERASREATERYQREHVTPWFYDGTSDCRIGHVRGEERRGDERWTVDTPEDLELVREVYRALGPDPSTDWRDVLRVLDSRPELRDINRDVVQKSYRD